MTELVYDQKELYKNARELVTISDSNDMFELVTVEIKKTPLQIRKAYNRSNIESMDKALEKGSTGLRA